MSLEIVVLNWKYSRLYNIRVHFKILANQGGRGRFSFTNFVASTTREVWWFYAVLHIMGNLVGLGVKFVCGSSHGNPR